MKITIKEKDGLWLLTIADLIMACSRVKSCPKHTSCPCKLGQTDHVVLMIETLEHLWWKYAHEIESDLDDGTGLSQEEILLRLWAWKGRLESKVVDG